MTIQLRNAKPIEEEGLAFAHYLDQAAEGFFRIYLGPQSEEIIARAYLQPDNDYSYDRVIFAERAGEIVGMATGYASEMRPDFSKKPLSVAAGGRSLRMVVVEVLFAPLFRMLETVSDGDYYLLSIAVDEKSRGEGIGSVLIEAIEKRARANGSARLALDVAAKNEGARRLYERHGMEVDSEWPRASFLPAVFMRMAKEL